MKASYRNFVIKTAKTITLEHAVFGLVEEAGEVAGVLKRLYRGDFTFKPAEFRSKMLEELGDLRWYLELCCVCLVTSVKELEQGNRRKLQQNKPKRRR
jgi:NTP pyrophosphatase (non-canonical NTP hydrolase)